MTISPGMKLTDAERLPCGCKIGNKDKTVVIDPCTETCGNYAYFITESRKQGKPIAKVDRDTLAVVADAGLCWNCDQPMTGHADPVNPGSLPGDGDFALCAYCGTWSVYDLGRLRAPTPEEQTEIESSEGYAETMEMVRLMREAAGEQ